MQNIGNKRSHKFLSQVFDLYGIPEKVRLDNGEAFLSAEYIEFCKSSNIEIEYCKSKKHTGTGADERAMQAMKNQIIAIFEYNLRMTECVNIAFTVLRFLTQRGLNITQFELHHDRKPGTELNNFLKDGISYLSYWSQLSVSADKKPNVPIYVPIDEKGYVPNYLVVTNTKAEEKAEISVSEYPFKFVEKNYNKSSLAGKFLEKMQTAVS